MTVSDFSLEMKWEFTSSLIPFFSKLAPSDVFKLTKTGFIFYVYFPLFHVSYFLKIRLKVCWI